MALVHRISNMREFREFTLVDSVVLHIFSMLLIKYVHSHNHIIVQCVEHYYAYGSDATFNIEEQFSKQY